LLEACDFDEDVDSFNETDLEEASEPDRELFFDECSDWEADADADDVDIDIGAEPTAGDA